MTQHLTSVTTWHLEMNRAEDLRPGPVQKDLWVEQSEVPCPEFSRFLFTAVGGPWYWRERLDWTYARWMKHLDRPEVQTWVGWFKGTPAGFCELEKQAENNVEIAYFGLLPAFIGRGFGGDLLSRAVQHAWEWGASRVWVHTCSVDGPHALANYQARGFTIFRVEERQEQIPDNPPGPWPGAAGP